MQTASVGKELCFPVYPCISMNLSYPMLVRLFLFFVFSFFSQLQCNNDMGNKISCVLKRGQLAIKKKQQIQIQTYWTSPLKQTCTSAILPASRRTDIELWSMIGRWTGKWILMWGKGEGKRENSRLFLGLANTKLLISKSGWITGYTFLLKR